MSEALKTELKIFAGIMHGVSLSDSNQPEHEAAALQWAKIEAQVMEMADRK